jgi:hypothetical protein
LPGGGIIAHEHSMRCSSSVEDLRWIDISESDVTPEAFTVSNWSLLTNRC